MKTHNANSHYSMVKACRAINILAVLPLASKASCAVSAATIAVASMANAASKYFRVIANGWWSADATTYIARRLPQIPNPQNERYHAVADSRWQGKPGLIIC